MPTKSARPAPKPKPSLQMVDNNGHKLAFHVTPGKQPRIVLDAGGGLDSSYWKGLVPRLAERTWSEIITYDRAGLGASDEVPGPWHIDNAVSDLESGLRALGATKNVILVSHSQAGEIATYFTRKHPDWISGAVLVDASVPNFFTDNEIARVVAATNAQIAALESQPSTKQTRQLLAVIQNYGPAHRAYHRMSWPTSVPAIVIASANTPFTTSPHEAQLWRDAQASFANGATNRRLVTAADSSHDIPLDRPEVVVEAITDLIGQVG